MIIEQQVQFLESLVSLEFSQSLTLSVSTSYSFKDILQNKETPIADIKCYGLSASLDAQLSKGLITKLRNTMFNIMDKESE
jgi:hypothetical protein